MTKKLTDVIQIKNTLHNLWIINNNIKTLTTYVIEGNKSSNKNP